MALGLVNCGSENSISQVESLILDVLVPIITSTSHDRIAVGVAIGMALMFLQTGDQGESILQMLRTHSNAYLRMSGALGTGLAHADVVVRNRNVPCFEEGVINVFEVDNLDILDEGAKREVYFLFREVVIIDGE